MVHQWQYLKLWLIAKTNSTVIIMCLKIFVLRSDISYLNKGNNKITELRTILQRESQNS
jgi:hypothetical protein